MNSEEPIQAISMNQQVAGDGHKLPEQAKVSSCMIPRPISHLNWIHQWQPMGIRVVVDLPFVSDDASFLFAIRNGPFIPIPWLMYKDQNNTNQGGAPVVGKPRPNFQPLNNQVYAWNNMRNVHHFRTYNPRETFASNSSPDMFPEKFGVRIVHYDYPPPLASFATMFRRWRGDMQYRIRTVAGFATQGYVFLSTLKNVPAPIGLYDPFVRSPTFLRQDNSYREAMMNAYIMADTSMYRHIEATVEFEYPVPYYDQFQWMARRTSPVAPPNFDTKGSDGVSVPTGSWAPYEPHGEIYLVMGVRGELAASVTGSQIAFELEYRAVEGFQFADPFLPNINVHRSFGNAVAPKASSGYTPKKVFSIPDRADPTNSMTDGISFTTKSVTNNWPPGTEPVALASVETSTSSTPVPEDTTLSPQVLEEQARRAYEEEMHRRMFHHHQAHPRGHHHHKDNNPSPRNPRDVLGLRERDFS